jgi:hypothetical protein
MKTLLRSLKNASGRAYAAAGAWLTVQLQTEPVRVRSAILSALVAAGTVLPALANHRLDETIAGLGASALTVAIGETARAKVSPADEK